MKKSAITQKVFRAGNSLVIAIPAKFRKMLGITEGDQVEIETDAKDQKITCRFPSPRQLSLISSTRSSDKK